MDASYGTSEAQKIVMFTKTFSLSPYTTFDNLLRAACVYWGLLFQNFGIYQLDDNPLKKPVNLSQEKERVLSYIDTIA